MATTTARSTADLLQLFLSLSTASKVVISKSGGRRAHHHLSDGAFRCRTCGRCFPTFQALGGHRTSHNRPRVRADGLDLLLGARPGKGAASDVHRCNTCGMVFPTGQALGGHMRRHRAAALDVAAAPETTAFEDDDDNEDDAGHHLTTKLFNFI